MAYVTFGWRERKHHQSERGSRWGYNPSIPVTASQLQLSPGFLRSAWTRSPARKFCQLETTTLDLTQLIAEGSTNAANFHIFEQMFGYLIFILKATWLPKQQRDYFLASKKRLHISSDGLRWNFGQNMWEIIVNHNLGQCRNFLLRFFSDLWLGAQCALHITIETGLQIVWEAKNQTKLWNLI